MIYSTLVTPGHQSLAKGKSWPLFLTIPFFTGGGSFICIDRSSLFFIYFILPWLAITLPWLTNHGRDTSRVYKQIKTGHVTVSPWQLLSMSCSAKLTDCSVSWVPNIYYSIWLDRLQSLFFFGWYLLRFFVLLIWDAPSPL